MAAGSGVLISRRVAPPPHRVRRRAAVDPAAPLSRRDSPATLATMHTFEREADRQTPNPSGVAVAATAAMGRRDHDDQVECPTCGRRTDLTVVLAGACHRDT